MKKSYNVLNTLLNFIGKNKEIDETEKVVLLVNSFFTKEDNKRIPNINKLGIDDIIIDESNSVYIKIRIVLVEAGLIVGRNGTTVKQLGGFISKNLNKKARIFIEKLEVNDYENHTD